MEEPRIDADVHTPIPTTTDLGAYLPQHWRDYLAENRFTMPPSEAMAYPPGSPIMPLPLEQRGIDAVRERVLAHAELAILNCVYGAEAVRHPYMAASLVTAVNEWLKMEWLDREPRLRASIVITPQDTEAAVAEIKRVAQDKRFVQVLVPARSWEPYGNHRYWPIWETIAQLGLPLGIHYGGFTGMPATPNGSPETYFEEYGGFTQLFADHVMSLLVEGVFDRYPDFKVALIESGVTWLPTWMWKLDTDWKATRREIPWVRRRPTEYVRERIVLTAEPFDMPPGSPRVGEMLQQLGSDEMLLWASDFPHAHGSDTEQLVRALDGQPRARFLRDNARAFYRLS